MRQITNKRICHYCQTILFFYPFEQLKDSEFFYCPHCKEDTGKNVPLDPSLGTEWEYAESSGKEPRLIWDIFWYCALVGKITKCCNGHSITSYHPGILQQISNYLFLLSHKRGMTKSTYDLIIRLVEQVNNFSSIESIFLSSFVDIVHRKLALINNTNMQTSIEFIEQLKLFTPSHDFITSCFVFNFDNYKDVYLSEMDKLTFIWLSGDHTFRVAANIGMYKDRRWIKLFDSLFCVLNEKGQGEPRTLPGSASTLVIN
eukprot:TCONS_00037362-protein